MPRTRTVIILICIAVQMVGNLKQAAAQRSGRRPGAIRTARQAADACLKHIRNCQLPDGAFVQVNHGAAPGAPVWIAPYFANHAALALVAAAEQKSTDRRTRKDDLIRVSRWLEWSASHQESNGYWFDWEGTRANFRSNGKVDAWDSSAAMFLLVAGRFQEAGGRVSPAVLQAAQRSLKCIEHVTAADGLTWAKPSYKVKYLMDNIEVYGGLRAGATLFSNSGLQNEAKRAAAQADRIGQLLPSYWQPAAGQYAYALHENGVFEAGLEKRYPHGLAQLFGIAFVEPHSAAWTGVGKFTPDNGPLAAMGPERWLIAASRMGPAQKKTWQSKLVGEVRSFDPQSIYIFRPAVCVLALLEGAYWMPAAAQLKLQAARGEQE